LDCHIGLALTAVMAISTASTFATWHWSGWALTLQRLSSLGMRQVSGKFAET
jgi:hypothetical protein